MTVMEFSVAHYQDGLTAVTVYESKAAALEARHGEFAGRIAVLGQRPAGSDGPWETITDALPPGVYGMADEAYHRHPALSASGAKLLLPPSCPALFRYQQDHPRESTPAFDYGHAAHRLVLGVGAKIVEVQAEDWRTKAAKAARDEAYELGQIPLLTKDLEIVTAMAEALKSNKIAMALFADGEPERSLFWTDEPTGIKRRGRLDWLPNPGPRRMILADYKSAVSASPEKFQKSLSDYGYHLQGATYLDAVKALGLADDPAFVFVVQEKAPPFLVSVFEPNAEALRIGRILNRRAVDLYAQCVATDTWPSYSNDVELLSVPPWYAREFEDILI